MEFDKERTAFFSGHRDIPDDQIAYVKEELRKEIHLAIQDGYTHFISGSAGSSDLYAASIVVELREENSDITLEAAIPHRERLETKKEDFQRLIKLCDKIHVCSEFFHKKSYFERNMYMANKSKRLIAVYDGRNGGGTSFTILYAQTIERESHIIMIEKQ